MLALWLTSFLIHLAEIFGYKLVACRQPTNLTFAEWFHICRIHAHYSGWWGQYY